MVGLVWVRLIDGRLWHIDEAWEATVCGATIRVEEPKQPELIDEQPPRGAWVCRRCVAELRRRADQAHRAALADPRRPADEPTVLDPDPSPPPWWMCEPDWSALTLWRSLAAEFDGRPFGVEAYVDWVMGECLHPWGRWPRMGGFRPAELEAARR